MAWSDEARRAAAEMRRRRAANEPWRRQRLTVRVAASDPTRVGGGLPHNKLMKTINLRAITDHQAKEKAFKFYRKQGYTNLKLIDVVKRIQKKK